LADFFVKIRRVVFGAQKVHSMGEGGKPAVVVGFDSNFWVCGKAGQERCRTKRIATTNAVWEWVSMAMVSPARRSRTANTVSNPWCDDSRLPRISATATREPTSSLVYYRRIETLLGLSSKKQQLSIAFLVTA
jgi:hypothetical protein